MGFIASGDSTTLSAYLTQIGREAILTGNKSRSNIMYFAFGDDDTNYNIANLLVEGFVPDITGSGEDCLSIVSLNVDIKNKITI